MPRLLKNLTIKLIMLGALLAIARYCQATDIGYSGPFVGTEGVALSSGVAIAKTYTRNMNTTGDRVTLQVVSSSYTVAVSTNFGSNNYTLNTPTITITGNGFTTGLPVLYSTGTVAISGLTNQTTYYISVINPNTLGTASTFKLASSTTNAVAGTGIVLASSSTASNRYTLAPLAFTNTTGGGIQIQWSNDGTNFVNATTGNWAASISSVTFSSSGGNSIYDLGPIQYRYLRIQETPPTTGAVNYNVTSNERYSVPH